MPCCNPRRILPCLLLAVALGGCQTSPHLVVTGNQLGITENRLRVAARVNGQPVNLIFDTGSETSILFQPAAEKLGLKITMPPPDAKALPGKVFLGVTESCRIQLLGAAFQGQFGVFNFPAGITPDEDGALSWQWLRGSLLSFDLNRQRVEFVSALPQGIDSWSTLPIVKENAVLSFTTPDAGGKKLAVLIDTGDQEGITLSPAQWRAWRAAHPNAPATLGGYYSPSGGLDFSEVCWADEFDLGPLKLTQVPISGSSSGEKIILGAAAFDASIGLNGLSRMDLVVDGKWGVIYARPENSPARPYNHNRLGAVFLPKDLKSDPLIAHVLPGTPAFEAGIRDGDVLRRVGDDDVTHWRAAGSSLHNINFWEKPAGTQLDLILQRDGRDFHALVTLRDLIGPSVKPAATP